MSLYLLMFNAYDSNLEVFSILRYKCILYLYSLIID